MTTDRASNASATRLALSAALGALLMCGTACCMGQHQTRSGKTTAGSGSGSGGATPAKAPPPAPAPDPPPDTAHQTDETAGKGADLAKIAVSPKNGSPYLGVRNELVVVNVFSDFQCPVCSRAADPIKQLAIDFPGKVRVVFRHNPLEMHRRARAAAMAAAAAGRQGKFWEYHDRLFANQRGLDEASLRQIAQDLGLNLDRWEEDRTDPKLDEKISDEAASVVKLGAPGTPGIFVNGHRSLGWGSYQGLKMQVQREITSGEALVAQGMPRSDIPAERIRVFLREQAKDASAQTSKPGEGPVDPEYWVQVLTAD